MMNATAQSNDQALAIFAHELREPLASILFAAQWLIGTERDELNAREMCEIVERQSRYLARMIEDVLEVSRGHHGKLGLQKDWFDLGTVLTNAVETTNALLTKRGHQLALSMPPERVCVLADPLRMQQVVVNLLTNAAKYTEPGGMIRLSAEVTPDQVLIEVRDNGIGIAEDFLPRVFDLYEQGSPPRPGAFSGLGIGLALVKSLVELHGGSVGAYSNGIGTGSAFVVRLPCVSPTITCGHIARGAPSDWLSNQYSATSSMTDA
jgi:signal transduction histidine kinase